MHTIITNVCGLSIHPSVCLSHGSTRWTARAGVIRCSFCHITLAVVKFTTRPIPTSAIDCLERFVIEMICNVLCGA